MRADELSFELPAERIAQRPVEPRDRARLLVVRRATGAREHCSVRDLPGLLEPGDLLVVNDTRVLPAKLHGVRIDTGGPVEVLLLGRPEEGACDALARPGKRLTPGARVSFGGGALVATVEAAAGRSRRLRFEGSPEAVAAGLERFGEAPLPPYIHRRAADPADLTSYQTIFAEHAGAVAAPTAGLHFTEGLLGALESRGVAIARLTLHVGWGTFAPLEAEELADHRVDPEQLHVPATTLARVRRARSEGRRVVAVGTTSARALESLSDEEAAGSSDVRRPTSLTIVPPHAFRRVDALLTNFHIPRSSLLALVVAFAGLDVVRAAYADAVAREYRFYSYGDASLFV